MTTIVGDMEIRLRADIARLQRDMDDARRIAGDAMDRIGRAAGVAKMAIGAIAGALSVAAFAHWIKGAIDAGDAANKLSAKTGIAVKDLAGLQMSFNLGGVSTDAMTSSMSRLSKGMVEGSKTLDVLRISTKNADGSFKSTRDVLYTLADKFAGMKDGAQKTSLALELFGKAGAELIPMLNGGSEAMREMDAMAVKLGMSISEDAAKKAEEFNDTLDLLHMGSEGVARSLAAEMLPTLTSLAGTFLTSMTEGDKLAKTAQFLGSAFKILYTVGLSVVEAFKTVGTIIGGTIAHITNVLGGFAEVAQKLIAGDFKGAVETVGQTMRQSGAIAVGVGEDIADSWKDTGKTISQVWDGSGADAINAMNKIRKAATAIGIDADTLAKQEAKRKKEAEAAEKALAKAREDGYKMQKEYMAQLAAVDKLKYGDITAEIADTIKQAEANEKLVATYGMSKLAIEQASLARVEEQLAQADSIGLTEVETEKLQALIDAKKRNIDAVGKVEKLDNASDVGRAKELLDIMAQVDEVTKSAAAGMADSFGKVGSAIGSLTTAISAYGRTQAAIAAELAVATQGAGGDSSKIQKANAIAAQQSAQAQVRSYADMSKAAKGFFKENSTGYKVMEGAEKAFRAYEMAMAIETMVAKSGFLTAFTGLFVTSKATQTAAETAAVAPSVAAAGAQSSAWGITAVVKAIASMPFPMNLAAGAATLAAVVAIGAKMVGGGGGAPVGVTTYQDKQRVQGTGTVLGDETAKSESIAHSLETMEKYASLELEYQNSMLTALKNIEIALGGAAKGIMQTTGITGGSAFGTVNSSSQNFFGADKTTTIADTGVKFSGTFGALRAGRGSGIQYEDVIKTSDGGWFHGDSTSQSTNTKNLSQEAMKPFALIFDNMGDLLVDAGVKLGRNGTELTNAINGINVGFEVSLRNLKGQELTDALNAGISVAFDKVTQQLFPTISQFQKMGEGLGETLVRVATDIAAVDNVFAAMGKSTLVTIRGTTETFGGTLRAGLVSVSEMSLEAKERLVELSGGMEKFANSGASFMRNFFSEDENKAATKARLNPVLNKLGLSTDGPDAQKLFKQFVIGLDTSTKSGAETYAMLMNVQQAFKDVTEAGADQRKDLLSQLDNLTMSTSQKRAKERAEMDASNRALFDLINARTDLADAYDRESDALRSLVDGMKSAQTSTLAYRDSLSLGSLSTLTPLQKAAEAQRQYEASVAKVLANPTDSQAYGASQAAATAFLTASQVINASGDAQVAAVAKVQSDMAMLAGLAGSQLTDAQRQLSVMDKQYGALVTLNESVLSFKDALLKVTELSAAREVGSSSATVNYAEIGTSNMAPLVAEIKSLRVSNEAMASELEGLRKEAFQHTEALIDSTQSAGAKTADTVVAGQTVAYTNAGWIAKSVQKEMLN